MSEIDTYAPGIPCWVELASTDVDAARAFYTALFGWDYDVAGPEAGNYVIPQVKGRAVAGMMTLSDEEQAQGIPAHWRTYVSVASADDTAARAKELGGTVVMDAFDVMDLGRMCALLDPEGAFIAAWEPREHVGAGIANEAGTLCWNELNTRDPDRATAFYSSLFGWTAKASEMDAEYTEWQVDGRSVAGMMRITPEMGPVPPNWLTYFACDDTDDVCAKAGAAGGAVFVPPTDIPPGRFAVAADPQGAVFAVITMADMSASGA